MTQLAELVTLAVGACTLAALVFAFFRWVRPGYRRVKLDAIRLRDVGLGRDPVIDPLDGRELAPAVPGLAARLAGVDRSMETLTQAVADIARSIRRHDELEDRFTKLEARVTDLEGAPAEVRVEATATVTVPNREETP